MLLELLERLATVQSNPERAPFVLVYTPDPEDNTSNQCPNLKVFQQMLWDVPVPKSVALLTSSNISMRGRSWK